MYEKIPEELKALRQWCCWRMEDTGAAKPTKIPYSINGQMANVNEPETWTDFNSAVAASKNYSGIGFVFTDTDNFSFIDLDDTNGDQAALDRQIKIFREFDSWSEISPSGKGLHVIVKGTVPAGRRRNFIEIYSSQRYATFTGNVYNDKPIKDCQDKLMLLWEQMGSGPVATNIYKGDDVEKATDKEIIEQASVAANSDKFKNLYAGNWQSLYPSQSEADYALIDIIAFYTQNRTQIMRLFRSSSLGLRDKAKRTDYISWMINKSFDRMLPPIDFDGFKIALDDKVNQLNLPLNASVAQSVVPDPHKIVYAGSNPAAGTISLPPGLVGEIAQFIYAAAPRPVPEIALAAAIGLMAGICGRAYNVSNMGLNQYVLLLGMTGVGKEAMASGIDRLMNSIKLQVPTSTHFIGPSEIASGQALLKYLSKNSQCFVSILGEFGIRLEIMSNPHANSAEKALKKVLLDLFNKSGHGQNLRSSIFADAEKNTHVIEAPAFSILGESTPERFYGALNEEMISEGLLPRFMLIEYNGPRPALSTSHAFATPSMTLIERLATLTSHVEQIMYAKKVIVVNLNEEAIAVQHSFDKYCDAQINSTHKEIIRQLWNRAHIKVLKLAALIAVGVNVHTPLITADYIQWAMSIVQNDIRALSSKFEQGLIGTNTFEIKQQVETIRVIKEYFTKDFEEIKMYFQGRNTQMLYKDKIIPYTYFNKRLAPTAAFKNDRVGSTVALKRALTILTDSDKLREVGKNELSVKYGTVQKAFMVSDMSLLD